MLKSSFHKIFSIEVLHTYFRDGICKDLKYQASEATEKIINRFSLKQKITTTGFDFYIASDKTIEEFLNYITSVTGEDNFTFNVTTNNSSFYQFTDLPINQIGIIKYTTNSVAPSSQSNEVVLKSDFTSTQEAAVLFMVSIHFKDVIALGVNTPKYKIEFKARATQWQYFIINKNHQNLGELSISNGSDIEFDEKPSVTLQNGEIAQIFSSNKKLLALAEVPKYSFNLLSTSEKNGTTRTTIIYKGLPSPNPSIMKINTKLSEPIVSSLMYVYV